jgi:hypothetical protein
MRLFQPRNLLQRGPGQLGALHATADIETARDGKAAVWLAKCGRRFEASDYRTIQPAEGDRPTCGHCRDVLASTADLTSPRWDKSRALIALEAAAAQLLAAKEIENSRLRLRVAELEDRLRRETDAAA